MCPQGPEGGLASRRASQATLKEALGALGTGGRRALCCYGGMSTRRTGWSEACEVHSGEEGNQPEVVLHALCPAVTCTNSFMSQKRS